MNKQTTDHGVPFGEAMKVWARVAALSFGGPAGQIAVMHRIIVEEKKWIGEQPLPAGAQLLHPAARPRGAAARHLYRLADAQDQGRAVRRHAVRAARPARHHGAELDLRAARQGHDRAGPVLRAEGRRAGDRDRGGAARRQARAQEQRHAWRWRQRPSSPSSSTTCRSPSSSSAPASSATVGGRAGLAAVPGRRRPRQGRRQAGRRRRFAARRGDARACQAQPALVALHRRACSWRSGWCRWRCSISPWAATTSSPRSRSSSARWPSSPSAAPMPCWPMSPSRRSSTITG